MLPPWQPLLVAVAQSVHKYAGSLMLPANASNCVCWSTFVGPSVWPGVVFAGLDLEADRVGLSVDLSDVLADRVGPIFWRRAAQT